MFKHESNTTCNTGLISWLKINTMNEEMIRLYAAAKEIAGIGSQAELARRLNVSSQVVKNWESRGISKAGLLAAQEALGCSAEWIQSGADKKRSRFIIKPNEAGYAIQKLESWDSSTPLDDEDVEIPLYKEVELAAGSGSTHSVEINGRKLRFAKSALRAAGVSPENAACATVTGNSMERLIMDGATIGIDRGRTQIKDGKIYAIDHGGMLRVKYLYRAAGGGLRLKSENDSEHPDETYTADQVTGSIKVLGWVFWWSQIATW